MARNETHFEYADKGATSVYKFRIGEDDPTTFVWFEYGDDEGSLYTTTAGGPYRAEDPLGQADVGSLEDLLPRRGTTKEQWIEDLLAQYGERIHWAYP